jgi:hypothetical protein
LCFISTFSGIFHFVTLEYFRYRDESSDDDEDGEERGDFVAGGIYAPPAQSISAAAANLTLSITKAAGIKRLTTSTLTEEANQDANNAEKADVNKKSSE